MKEGKKLYMRSAERRKLRKRLEGRYRKESFVNALVSKEDLLFQYQGNQQI